MLNKALKISVVSIIAEGNSSNTNISVCEAAKIGATLTDEVEGNSYTDLWHFLLAPLIC